METGIVVYEGMYVSLIISIILAASYSRIGATHAIWMPVVAVFFFLAHMFRVGEPPVGLLLIVIFLATRYKFVVHYISLVMILLLIAASIYGFLEADELPDHYILLVEILFVSAYLITLAYLIRLLSFKSTLKVLGIILATTLYVSSGRLNEAITISNAKRTVTSIVNNYEFNMRNITPPKSNMSGIDVFGKTASIEISKPIQLFEKNPDRQIHFTESPVTLFDSLQIRVGSSAIVAPEYFKKMFIPFPMAFYYGYSEFVPYRQVNLL
ncbi:MAG: hypothetical protein IPN22_11275 [Bacteroidetes bacterium]|nr:hypothetical protein [Bacteroidota bacterium]